MASPIDEALDKFAALAFEDGKYENILEVDLTAAREAVHAAMRAEVEQAVKAELMNNWDYNTRAAKVMAEGVMARLPGGEKEGQT